VEEEEDEEDAQDLRGARLDGSSGGGIYMYGGGTGNGATIASGPPP
jgi:hypothetical protein